MEICPEAWTGQNSQRTELRDRSFGAAWNGYADAGTCLGPIVHIGLRAELDGAGAIGRAPSGAVGCFAFDRRCGCSGRSSEAGTYWQYEDVTHNDYGARAKTAGVAEPTDLAMVNGLAELYPSAEIPKQSFGTAEVMPSADLGESSTTSGRGHRPGLCTKLEPLNRVVGTSLTDHDDIWAALWHSCRVLGSGLHP